MRLNIIISAVISVLSVSVCTSSGFLRSNPGITDKLLQKIDISKQNLYDSAGNIRDTALSTWDHSQVKEWAEAHGLVAPPPNDAQKLKQFVAKHRDILAEDIAHYTNEASKTASPYISKAKGYFQDTGRALFESAAESWSDSRLREFLESRDVAVPKVSSRQQLLELVQKYKDKAIDNTKSGSWTFDTWSAEDLIHYLKEKGTIAEQRAEHSRDQLVALAYSEYEKAKSLFKQGSDDTAKQYSAIKKAAFDKWSDSDLKAYLESFGVKADRADRSELQRLARTQYELFTHGTQPGVLDKAKLYGDDAKSAGLQWFHSAKNNLERWIGRARQRLEL